jgi:hypothetical protein
MFIYEFNGDKFKISFRSNFHIEFDPTTQKIIKNLATRLGDDEDSLKLLKQIEKNISMNLMMSESCYPNITLHSIRTTQASLYNLTKKTDYDFVGISTQSVLDKDDKNLGKKIALQKLLDKFYPDAYYKPLRSIIWYKFFEVYPKNDSL